MLTYDVFEISDGSEGTGETLLVMQDLAAGAQLDPITRHTALRILNASMSRDRIQYGKAVWRWVRRRVRLVDEPIELIQPPEFLLGMLDSGHYTVDGDCDDATTLAAALIFALGIPVRFVAVRITGTVPFAHVFCEMLAGGAWWAVDPTVIQIPPGPFDRMVMEV